MKPNKKTGGKWLGTVLAAVLLHACASSESVVQLVDRVSSNQEILESAHQEAIHNQQLILTVIPKVYENVSQVAGESCEALVTNRTALLKSKIDIEEEKILNLFETKAWALSGDAFDRRFESIYLSPIQALGEKEQGRLKALADKKLTYPNDARIALDYRQKQVHLLSLSLTSLRDELEMKDRLKSKLKDARIQVHQLIQAEFANIRQKADALSEGVCTRSSDLPAAFAETRNTLERTGDLTAQLYSEQKKALEAVKLYMNRRSPVQLIFVGAGDELKGKVTGLQEKVGEEISGLKDTITGYGKDLLGEHFQGADTILAALDLTGERVRRRIDGILSTASQAIESEISRTATLAVKKLEAQITPEKGE